MASQHKICGAVFSKSMCLGRKYPRLWADFQVAPTQKLLSKGQQNSEKLASSNNTLNTRIMYLVLDILHSSNFVILHFSPLSIVASDMKTAINIQLNIRFSSSTFHSDAQHSVLKLNIRFSTSTFGFDAEHSVLKLNTRF